MNNNATSALICLAAFIAGLGAAVALIFGWI